MLENVHSRFKEAEERIDDLEGGLVDYTVCKEGMKKKTRNLSTPAFAQWESRSGRGERSGGKCLL